ncbi:MAG: hypothetical protein LBQ23_01230 [Puniceicoccales bacterium]|nr:hypothetical protein [Puniceicoccales bacterium]
MDINGILGFSLNNILCDNASRQIEQLKTSIKTAINAGLKELNLKAVKYIEEKTKYINEKTKIGTFD